MKVVEYLKERKEMKFVFLALVVVVAIILAMAFFGGAGNPEVGKATGESALKSMEDICGNSYVESLASLKEAGKQEAPEEYLAENSVYVLDEVAIEKYAETYITGAESTAQAKNITTEQLIKDELGFNSIDDYRAEAKKEVESFVKKRLAVYEAAKKKHIKIGSGENEELLPAYASNFGYNTEEEFEYACTPGSIANEMLYDKTTAKLKGSK